VPEFDFAATVEEREEFGITLSRTYDDDGNVVDVERVVLPKVLPAKLMLQFYDMDRKELKKIQDDPRQTFKMGMNVIEAVVGREQWDRIVATIGMDNIEDLMIKIFDYYGLTGEADSGTEDEEGKEEGKEEEGQSQLTTSSTTSEPSTPTLNGSTEQLGGPSTEVPLTGSDSFPVSPTYPQNPSS